VRRGAGGRRPRGIDGRKLTLDDEYRGEPNDPGSDPEERRNLFYEEAQLEGVQVLVAGIRHGQRCIGDGPIRFDEDAWRQSRARLL